MHVGRLHCRQGREANRANWVVSLVCLYCVSFPEPSLRNAFHICGGSGSYFRIRGKIRAKLWEFWKVGKSSCSIPLVYSAGLENFLEAGTNIYEGQFPTTTYQMILMLFRNKMAYNLKVSSKKLTVTMFFPS